MSVRIVRREQGPAAPLPVGLHPVLARVYSARKVRGAGELDTSLSRLLPWQGLRGIEAAVDVLADALSRDRRILVVADFDADGATSCAIAVRGLRALGARQVGYVVPNRFEFGYGLTPEIVEVAARGHPDLLLTVDNGVSSVEGVEAARARGIDVLITDHHLPGPRLPDAVALVNPNQPGCAFASKHLAGCGVMFYVLVALRARLREGGWFEAEGIPEPKLAALLDLAALGTVADVVRLDHNNRILVEQGLRRIRAGRAQPGVLALLRAAGRDPARAVASDLAFGAGPRLNAAGRLTDMSLGIECLLSDDPVAVAGAAARLDALNRERRDIEQQMQAQAEECLARMQLTEGGSLPVGLCLYDEGWHQGIIGILASRVRERLHRPVIAFAPAGDGIKGSARSVPGLHIRDALEALAARRPGLVRCFGGHAMAAGLSLAARDYEAFAAAFDEEVQRSLDESALQGVVLSDGELEPVLIDLPLAEALRAGGPWGQGFPEPVFDGFFEVLRSRVVGERHLKLTLRAGGAGGASLDAIAFNAGPQPPAPRVHAAYRVDVNDYQGRRRVQLVVEHMLTAPA